MGGISVQCQAHSVQGVRVLWAVLCAYLAEALGGGTSKYHGGPRPRSSLTPTCPEPFEFIHRLVSGVPCSNVVSVCAAARAPHVGVSACVEANEAKQNQTRPANAPTALAA